MWPFSTPKQVVNELTGSYADLDHRIRELELRIKQIEREHDDLHAAYRRLRGGLAREAVGAGSKAPPATPEALQEHPGEPVFDKDELRRRYLGRGRFSQPRGNGEK
jgi:hypothetical protein